MGNRSNKIKSPVYKKGDYVKVRSQESISRTLDAFNKLDGCFFMNQMYRFCGKKFLIIKVVINIFDERQCKMYKALTPLYILEDLICDGDIDSFSHRCDRSCYFLWHEDWLQKA